MVKACADAEEVRAVQWDDALAKTSGALPSESRRSSGDSTALQPAKCTDCSGVGHKSDQCPTKVTKAQGRYAGLIDKKLICRVCCGSGHLGEHHSQSVPASRGSSPGARQVKSGSPGRPRPAGPSRNRVCKYAEKGETCPFGSKCKFSHKIGDRQSAVGEDHPAASGLARSVIRPLGNSDQELAVRDGLPADTVASVTPSSTEQYLSLDQVPGAVKKDRPPPGTTTR